MKFTKFGFKSDNNYSFGATVKHWRWNNGRRSVDFQGSFLRWNGMFHIEWGGPSV